ncbi:hypothetical protein CARUB_v10028026mg [Capsella rubella]|uniref:Plant thionin family protein n=1 Tax=Capsella rubella TaxID=81985 RepID=R0GU74_9BRAS|nr:hypothetical protein CARUB_v10028026mg [Capsella rubella]
MENKWSVGMMVFVLVMMVVAIEGEAAYLSCETKCKTTCRDSLYPRKCKARCLKSCRHYHPPTQLHTSSQ